MSQDHLERVRRVCLALPEATEKIAWGEPTFRVKDKLFAMYADATNHHGGGRDCLWCHAPAGAQEMLVAAEPERFFVPPYVGKSGWVGLVLDRVQDLELEVHVRQAYLVVAPKKLKALVESQP
jgi:hypothetical protein